MTIAIVGAGPAGAALAYLFARRGLRVALFERQSDFAREFRGEGLMPGGVDALAQMGLGGALDALPQARIERLEIFLNRRRAIALDLRSLPADAGMPRFVSQPALLEMLVAEAAKFPGFELHRGVTVRDLAHDASGRVTGVRVDGAEGAREIAVDLVIGCDGRASLVRKRSGLERPREAQSFDVVWCKLPLPPFLRGVARGCLGVAHFAICFEAPDGLLQLGWAIDKGRFGDIRRGGIDAWIAQLVETVPGDLADWLRAHAHEITSPFLLDVVCDHLDVWSAPGVLLLGDAAHPMSPVGAQGINIALRDALVAANHLGPALVRGDAADALDAAARAVVAERLPEVVEIQRLQSGPPPLMLQQTPLARFAMRWIAPLVLRSGIAGLAIRRVLPRFARGTTEVRLRF